MYFLLAVIVHVEVAKRAPKVGGENIFSEISRELSGVGQIFF